MNELRELMHEATDRPPRHHDDLSAVLSGGRRRVRVRRAAVVGGEQHLEGRAGLDLRVELARGAGRHLERMAAGGAEPFGDPGQRPGEVGRHGHLHLAGLA